MDKKMEKKQCRKKIQKKIAVLTKEYNEEASQKIFAFLCEMEVFQKAKSIFCFVGTPSEIDTHSIIQYAWKHHKKVAVPKCLEKGHMEAYIITKEEDLEVGKFGIMEPKEECKVLMPEQIDLIILPCLSCDRKGNRLGYGGGYYDRYLERCIGVRVVICREKLMLDEIPSETFDQKGDFLVTEKGIFPIKS